MKTSDEMRPAIPRKYEPTLDALKELWGLPSHSQVIIRLIVLSKYLKMHVIWIFPDGKTPENEHLKTLYVQTPNIESTNHDQIPPYSDRLESQLTQSSGFSNTQKADSDFDDVLNDI